MENKKPKEFRIPTVPDSVNSISPNADTVQNDFRYGKNQEKLKASQVEGAGGRYAVGSSSRSTTGTQSFTVGFKPKLVKINAVYAASAGGVSHGSATSVSSQFNINSFANPSAAAWSYGSTIVYVNWTGAGTTVASLSSIDATGFTLNWSSIGPAVNFVYECYG